MISKVLGIVFWIFLALLVAESFTARLNAQVTLTVTGPATASPGQTVNITVSLSSAQPVPVAAVGWALILPTGFSVGIPVLSPTQASADKTALCAATTPCIVYGLNSNPLSDGLLVTLPLTIAPTVPVGPQPLLIAQPAAANGAGDEVTVASGSPYAISILPSKCDTNGDGKVTGVDVRSFVDGFLGTAPCPVAGACTVHGVMGVVLTSLGVIPCPIAFVPTPSPVIVGWLGPDNLCHGAYRGGSHLSTLVPIKVSGTVGQPNTGGASVLLDYPLTACESPTIIPKCCARL